VTATLKLVQERGETFRERLVERPDTLGCSLSGSAKKNMRLRSRPLRLPGGPIH
jgi:hypothetical protein